MMFLGNLVCIQDSLPTTSAWSWVKIRIDCTGPRWTGDANGITLNLLFQFLKSWEHISQAQQRWNARRSWSFLRSAISRSRERPVLSSLTPLSSLGADPQLLFHRYSLWLESGDQIGWEGSLLPASDSDSDPEAPLRLGVLRLIWKLLRNHNINSILQTSPPLGYLTPCYHILICPRFVTYLLCCFEHLRC